MKFIRWMLVTVLAGGAAFAQEKQPEAAKVPPQKEEKPKPPAWTSAEKAPRDFAIQGEYEIHTGSLKSGVQVIALGQEGFRAVMYSGGLPGAGWDGKGKEQVNGGWEASTVVFRRPGAEQFFLNISADSAKGMNNRGQPFAMKKVHRKSPTLGMKPPEGALVLFDSTNTDAWQGGRMTPEGLLMMGTTSKQKFQDCVLHVEFILPFMPDARGQGRSNSGVYLHHRYEVQVLDSFGLKGENNECGGIYTVAAPKVNMCLPPLVWQTYDIDYTAPRFDEQGKKIRNAIMTVKHNGVVIHENQEVPKLTGGSQPETPGPGPIHLQDHGNPVFYRNIWVIEKK